jgi:DNA mismatch repair protein MutL
MIHNEQPLFSTQGNGDRLQGIHTLYGRINGGKLLPVSSKVETYCLEGYISDPGEHRSNRKSQVFFVNGRVINNKPMERALDKAYSQRLFDGRHPIAYLFLEVPAEDLDVNIHPNKREVRFHRESEVEEFVRTALTSTLQGRDAIPGLDKSRSFDSTSIQATKANRDKPLISKQVDINTLLSSLREQQNFIAEETIDSIETPTSTVPSKAPQRISSIQPMEPSDNRFHPEALTSLGVAFGTYIIATDEDTLYLIDQHAAHERILFEQILSQMDNREKFKQLILMPFTVKCSITESEASDAWLHVLSEMGYTLEPFGPNTYLVKEIPGFLTHEEAERFLSDFLDHVTEDTELTNRKVLIKAASNACKEAVKGREHLSPEEIDELFIRLSQCENPLSCPHGRPTFIRFSQHEIERKFRRT